MIHGPQSVQISQKQDRRNIYVIMKTMCPPSHHHNGFVATHAFGHMIYGYELYEYGYEYGYVCSITSEPSQNNSRHVLSFKDSSALLNN